MYQIIRHKKIIISSNFIPIISDFDLSTIYKNENITYEQYENQQILGKNIYKTFNECLLLLKNESEKELIKKKLQENYEHIEKYVHISEKNFRSYYKKYNDYDYYIKNECEYMLAFSSYLLRLINENTTKDWYD